MMNDRFQIVVGMAMLTFLLAAMLELGLGLTWRQVMAPLKNGRLMSLTLAANFVVVPLLAVGLAKVFRLDAPFAIGLLLLGLAPGAPFLPKVVQLARGNLAFATGLMVLLMVGTVAFLPLVLPHVVVGAEVSAWKIAQPLLVLMLLPLGVGMGFRARFPVLPAWIRRSLGVLANVCGLLVMGALVAVNFQSALQLLANGALVAGLLLVGVSVLLGWLLGGHDPGIRTTLALGTGSRNIAAALLVGALNFPDPRVNVMVIVTALASLMILLPLAGVLGIRAGRNEEGGSPGGDSMGSPR